jgi:membrane-bound lytic murein transglycosylase B
MMILAGVLSTAWGSYSNCTFQEIRYSGVCEKAVSQGVSLQYANQFLLSFRTTKRDNKSLKLFKPQKITTHHSNEKRANNTLVKYVPQIVKHLLTYKEVYDYAEKSTRSTGRSSRRS